MTPIRKLIVLTMQDGGEETLGPYRQVVINGFRVYVSEHAGHDTLMPHPDITLAGGRFTYDDLGFTDLEVIAMSDAANPDGMTQEQAEGLQSTIEDIVAQVEASTDSLANRGSIPRGISLGTALLMLGSRLTQAGTIIRDGADRRRI